MAGADHDHVELFGEDHHGDPARLGPSPSASAAFGIQGSGFRRAAQTPRKRLKLASGVAGADHDHVELFGELNHWQCLFVGDPSLRSGFRPSTTLRAGSAGSRFAHARKRLNIELFRELHPDWPQPQI